MIEHSAEGGLCRWGEGERNEKIQRLRKESRGEREKGHGDKGKAKDKAAAE